jgi:ribonucleoside-diphosphate reductase alpha chain
MGQKGKFLITSEGRFDLETCTWDDQLFTNILVKDNPIDMDQAMGISRSLREEISKMEFQTITISFIEKMIEAKLLEFGLTKPSPIRLDNSIFRQSELNLSENARTVLKRRYLRKDSRGKIIETPEQMFRRVARHIAKAEKNYGADAKKVKRTEEVFYKLMTESKFLPGAIGSLFCPACGRQYGGHFWRAEKCGLDPQIRWRYRFCLFAATAEKQHRGNDWRSSIRSGILHEDIQHCYRTG